VPTTTESDRLFTLPLEEFTPARNALAAALKKAGHVEEADRVRQLAKPSVSAWAVNQLYWRHRVAFDRLLTSGERFRKAQASQLSGRDANLRGSLDARREALGELMTLAGAVLQTSGHAPTPDTMRRITTTLEALASVGAERADAQAGRLSDDLAPPGFEALAALVPRSGRARAAGAASRVIPFQQTRGAKTPSRKRDPEAEARRREEEKAAAMAAAKAAVQEGQRTLADARQAAARAEATLKKAAARAKETDKVRAELEKRFEKAASAADEARTAARRIASEAEAAAQALDDAERALAEARRRLAELT
jgi:hypothetical protein